ncbi:hypothetical protein DXV75_09060 [Alteromonas aestuariivivens]|uniref:Uncharacterized protein n=1 Tax=Alteromonas aestuariivivens TaxID=1938339 RepID=A0A3D8M6M5_9ALTE|nr:glycoside hydrolase family 88 protein [Alteromonas aestuariivivens]RDV25442.1 hypothetical protein DXV75_09060 [Alteromonas aestuariivivens]
MPQPETNGTAFFTYGLFWGISHGLHSKQDYLEAAMKGWAALNSALDKDGKIGWAQQIGDAPDLVSYDDSQLYAVGGFLLAGSEVFDYYTARNDESAHSH